MSSDPQPAGTAAAYGAADAIRWVAVPEAGADKYSRGVLGVLTGSDAYPGAAVLGVEGAARTGVGMIRYLGPDRAAGLVLHRRPEIVTADGRVQAWLLGSGTTAERDDAQSARLADVLGQGLPTVLDAGALDLVSHAVGPTVVTPHFGEAETMLRSHDVDVDRASVAADPARWAVRLADVIGATVLLKGATTYIADAAGLRHTVPAGPPWVATAGAGDVLGGVLAALLATHADELDADAAVLADLAAAAAWLHGEAGRRASGGGPITALDIAEAMPATIAGLLAAR